MPRYAATIAALVAGLVLCASPAPAVTTSTQGSMMIADIGRDAIELSRVQEVLPSISDCYADYPETQRALHIHGSTTVAVGLDEKGNIIKTFVYKSSGNTFLDKNALYAMQFATFKPGTIAGTPVAGVYSVIVDYNDAG